MADWNKFKIMTESLWEDATIYERVSGYQIQPKTKWNPGLSDTEISHLADLFGLKLPYEYQKMLAVINGFDRENIDIYEEEQHSFRSCYKYPDDLEVVKPFIEELHKHFKYIKTALKAIKLDDIEIKGFIPLYSHRALVVFEDLTVTPVVSAVEDDVIIYGNSLIEYWQREFKLEKNF